MRLSEKTLELSITSQLTQRLNLTNAIWFGLTQKQESKLGFDVASNVAGRLVILQFKASSIIVHPARYTQPRRQFSVPHGQLANLQALAQAFPNSVYYVFPNIGTTQELTANRDLISQSWLLDVAALPNPFPPATNTSQTHYAFIDPPLCDMRSEPVEAKIMTIDHLLETLRPLRPNSSDMVNWLQKRQFRFRGMRAYGLFIPIV